MADKRDHSTLFELIRTPAQTEDPRMRVPEWAKPRSPEEQEAGPTPSRSVSARTASRAQAAKATREKSAKASRAGSLKAAEIGQWLTSPTQVALPRWGLIASIIIVAWILALAYQAGKVNGRSQLAQAEMRMPAENQTSRSLSDLREGEIDPDLIPSYVTRVGETAPPPPIDAPADAATIRNRPLVTPASADPRISGLHYFRLAEIPVRVQADGERMVQFLRSQGVDVTMIPVKNGRSLVVYVLPGFRSPSSGEAEAYRNRLIKLGQMWKAQGGATDFAGMYAPLYRGEQAAN